MQLWLGEGKLPGPWCCLGWGTWRSLVDPGIVIDKASHLSSYFGPSMNFGVVYILRKTSFNLHSSLKPGAEVDDADFRKTVMSELAS